MRTIEVMLPPLSCAEDPESANRDGPGPSILAT